MLRHDGGTISIVEAAALDAAPVERALSRSAIAALALAAVVVLRLLYLARFGWDPGWMNLVYFARAKDIWLHGAVGMGEQPPLVPLALVGLRKLGLHPLPALNLLYLLAHLLFAQGTLALARAVWPDATRRRLLFVGAAIALTPLLSTIAGYRNLGALVGAALLVSSIGNALAGAAQARGSARLVAAALAAAVGSTARFETLAGAALAGLCLALPGPWRPRLRRARLAGLGLLLGAALGAAGLQAARQPAPTGAKTAGYGFYTFYDGLPWLLWSDKSKDGDEYGRYRDSARWFGTVEENGGSIAQALFRHPWAALLRVAAKPFDWLGALLWIGSITPLGLLAAAWGLRESRSRALIPFAAPLALLLVPSPAPPYFLAVAPPVLLAAAAGCDRALESWPARRLASSFAAAAALVLCFGKADVMNSPVLTAAAADVEERCAAGCLTNVVPQSIRYQAWVDLEGPAPLQTPAFNDERKILRGELDPDSLSFAARVRRARLGGFHGPVFYLAAQVSSFTAFHPQFDREAQVEGQFDLSSASVEATFRHGPDAVTIYRLEDPTFLTSIRRPALPPATPGSPAPPPPSPARARARAAPPAPPCPSAGYPACDPWR